MNQFVTDFALLYDDGGSIVLLTPLTDAACEWVQEHLPEDAPKLGASYAIEWRYAPDIVDGFCKEGLTVRRGV